MDDARRNEELRRWLAALRGRYGRGRVERDPVSRARRYADPRDREVAGLVASALAFGGVGTILASVDRVLAALGPRPARALAGRVPPLDGFRHRWVDGEDVAALLAAARSALRVDGSLEALFPVGRGRIRERASAFVRALRERAPGGRRGLRFLLPDPADGSAAKRLCLFLRWMARPDDGVDLGVWTRLDPADLVIPLDTHVFRIARRIGLTARRTPGWRTAEEVTAALRRICPRDPVRYDFALAHLGMSGDTLPGGALRDVESG